MLPSSTSTTKRDDLNASILKAQIIETPKKFKVVFFYKITITSIKYLKRLIWYVPLQEDSTAPKTIVDF